MDIKQEIEKCAEIIKQSKIWKAFAEFINENLSEEIKAKKFESAFIYEIGDKYLDMDLEDENTEDGLILKWAMLDFTGKKTSKLANMIEALSSKKEIIDIASHLHTEQAKYVNKHLNVMHRPHMNNKEKFKLFSNTEDIIYYNINRSLIEKCANMNKVYKAHKRIMNRCYDL